MLAGTARGVNNGSDETANSDSENEIDGSRNGDNQLCSNRD
jgi:hypothetical protein